MLAYNEYLYLDGVLLDGVLGPFNGTGVDNALVRWDGTNYRNIQECPGITVDDSGHLTSAGNILAATFDTNVAAAGVTLSGTTLLADGTDSSIDIAITPKGTGEVDITKVDIDSGTIDGCTISTSNITVGAGYTFDVSAGTLTLADDQISGDKIEGGTIAGITINDLVVSTSLGMGVVSPCSLVEIWDDDAHPILSITAAHATDYDPQIQFRTDVTDTVKCSMGIDSGDSDKFKIYMGSGIGDTSQFVITSAGNVGIGTDVPGVTLDIKGNYFRMYSETSYTPQWIAAHYNNTSASAGYITLRRAQGTFASPLNVVNYNTLGTFVAQGYYDGSFRNSAYIDFYVNGSPSGTNIPTAIRFATNNGSSIGYRMVILANGNVGIGETVPETLVEMTHASPFMTFHCSTESDAADSGICKLLFKREQANGTETTHAAIYVAHDGASADQKGYLSFLTNDGADGNAPTERMRIDSSGNVGIGKIVDGQGVRCQVSDGVDLGTDWVSTFDIFAVTGQDVHFAFVDTDEGTWGSGLGLKQVDGTTFENAWGIIRQTNGDGDGDGSLNFTYGTSNTISSNGIKVTIDTNGNMGIAQPTPSQKLDVTGNINVTSTVFTDTLDSTHAVGTGLPTASDSNLILRDSTAVAAGVGGSIVFTGKYTGSTYLSGAPYIRTSKESAVSGEYGFALTFGTRAHSQACSEKLRIMGNGNVGVGVSDPDSQTEIAASAASVTALHLKAAASQTANIFTVTDSSDNNLVWITSGGKIQGDTGLRTTANDWGDGLSTWAYGEWTAEHTITNDAGNFDATGNANGEKYFYDTTNSPFTQDDEDNRNWIVIQSGTFKGAKAEILEYISADGVLIHAHGACWDEDLSSVDYKVVKAPQFITSSCYDTHLHTGTQGQFHIGNTSGAYTGDVGVEIDFTVGADNSDVFHIHCDAGGYNNVDAMQLFYNTGDLQTGDHSQVIQISIDKSAATAGEIDGINIGTTNTSSAEAVGIHIGTGFENALLVSGSSAQDPDYGYETTSGTSIDRVNSGGAGDDAFINPAVDQELFDNNGDDILIGSDNMFEVIEIIWAVLSSKNLAFNFYYSKTGGGWTQFYPDDGTQGGTKNGLISFSAPGDWTKDDEDIDGNAITEAYYIAITRTYAYVVPTLPTEDHIKIYAERAGDTSFKIKGNGVVKTAYLSGAPGSEENGDMWMEADGLHLYYAGAEQVVAVV